MKWKKFTLTTTTEAVDLISYTLDELGIEGIEIEDNIPLTEKETKGMFIDILPELPPDEGVAKVSFYLDEDDDIPAMMAKVKEALEELKPFTDLGACTFAESETEDKDWINNWKQYFKPFTVDDILIKPTWETIPEEHKDKLPAQLSGGEQQRAAIAVALANKPDILLADEPTGAVDTRTADTIYELFQKLNKELGITIIIVTHDMALAGRVDRTVLISDGKVSTEKLKKHPAMEYTVLDKAHRIKLTDEMLEAAGIESNKVRVDVQDGKLVISRI